MKQGRWTLWIYCWVALAWLPAFGGAEPAAAPKRAPSLERKLLESLADIFLSFDVIRAVASHPATNVGDRTRVDAYNTYITDLEGFGLAPQDELGCLFSLASPVPPRDERKRTEFFSAPIRRSSSRFAEIDPCYPIRGKPKLDRPWGWDFDDGDDGNLGGRPAMNRGSSGRGGNGGGVGREY